MKNLGTVISIIIIIVLLLIVLGGAAVMGWGGFGMMGGYGGMMGGYGGFGFNPFGMILSLFFWAIILVGLVLFIVWLVRNVSGTTQSSSLDPAIEILKERYARGEITKEQFDAIKQDLQK